MRIKHFIFLFFLLPSSLIRGQTLTDSLKGYYPLNGDFQDLSGFANHISLGTGIFVEDRFGHPTGALELNGTSDSLVLPIPEFGPIEGDFGISIWYKTNSPEILNLFSSKESPSDTTDNFEVQLNSHSAFYLENYAQTFYQSFAYWNGTGNNNNAFGEGNPGLFTKGDWCHFVITREAGSFRIYLNRQEHFLSLNSFYNQILGDAVDLVFGSAPHGYSGAIDDLRFYNRAITQQDIDKLWFENRPFHFIHPKANQAYVQGSQLVVQWEYDPTVVSDSIVVEYRINEGPWLATDHSGMAWDIYLDLDLSFPFGTSVEIRVTDAFNPDLNQSSGLFFVSEYDWMEVTGSLPFAPKDGAGLLNFQGKMWLLGGWDPPLHPPHHTHNEVWNSTNGSDWTFVNNAPWPARHCSAWLVHDNAMWVIGGDPQSGCLTDVWRSNDGIEWSLVLDAIPGYSLRLMPNYASFDNELIIYGGEVCSGPPLSEVWRSPDGINWTQLPVAPWKGRGMQINSCVDDEGNLWMLGGSNESTRRSYNEVWKTSDGLNWTLVNSSAPWAGRYWHTVAWFDGKMWVMGGVATGVEMNDVWYSSDGINWFELKSATGNWPAGSRHAQSTTVFDNALWYMCGIATNNAWKIYNTSLPDRVEENKLNEGKSGFFPNPAKDLIHLNFAAERLQSSFVILDIFGRVRHTEPIQSTQQSVDIGFLPPGTYFIVLSGTPVEVMKMVKI